jgi:hypothetical protein
MKKIISIAICCLLFVQKSNAQFYEFARPIMDTLCSANYNGRGYINDGVNKAADFLANQFTEIGLKNFDNTYFQNYQFAINSLPSVSCIIDGKVMKPGEHFLVDAACPDVKGTFRLLPFSYTNAVDKELLFAKLKQGLLPNEALLMKNAEDNRQFRKFVDTLDSMGFKIPLIVKSVSKKLLWTTSQQLLKIQMKLLWILIANLYLLMDVKISLDIYLVKIKTLKDMSSLLRIMITLVCLAIMPISPVQATMQAVQV